MQARPQQQLVKDKNNNDSKTKADLRLHGGRDRVTVRVKPELKEALKGFCNANGLSLCHVYEMLVSGYLTGMKQKINWVSQSPTIELTVVRDVKRVRRYVRESDGGHDVFIEDLGSFKKCCFCDLKAVAIHFFWTDSYRCVRKFVCQSHHEELKSRSGAWKLL